MAIFQFAITEDVSALSAFAASNHCDVTEQGHYRSRLHCSQFEASSSIWRWTWAACGFLFGVDTYYIDWNRVVASVANDPHLYISWERWVKSSASGGAFRWEDNFRQSFWTCS